mmetsp:Transcript_9382/g.30975  ORF Transcript_9382/g.30975 Transcript_9382/m.30975 type:complete len:365 (-) Transcript_9382:138-1232(-)|eukprot:CAMPEP_0170145268 /NCGR_PEP_ID=MMETSP0033_2-20121228/16424_1 /TAXON_ID=195969 /ORGANISM="Dolichomastix tenuilepis, Strain CCMP3274" /LENGTH=364 /DNA_ID=CAMNT_0010381813 /DNA_START=131 /DNA_END=1225 /DNA_ORIENTATION=-
MDEKGPIRKQGGRRGKHNFVIWRNLFEIDLKYTPIKPIGKGAYGVVCSAKNTETNEKLAIKKISNAFDNVTDARRTLREIKLLRHLRHENIVALRDIMRPPSLKEFNDVYLVYELMDTDLHQIIRSSQALSDEHCQYFVYQILRGLKYVHSAQVLHRDLKPSNVLLNANCDLKICDFGLARTCNERGFMTEYVVTRWYRAPELLLSCDEYGTAIDVWSVGCIMIELLARKPIFPGKDYIHQLKLIVQTLGSPAEEDLMFITSQKARTYIRSLPPAPKVNWLERFPDANPLCIDLIEKMLVFNPNKRCTVEEALEHPYLASLHDASVEPSSAPPFDFEFEDQELKEDQLREKVFSEIEQYLVMLK